MDDTRDPDVVRPLGDGTWTIADGRLFEFYEVLDETTRQEEIFDQCYDLIQLGAEGTSVALLVMGPKGCGRKHTIRGVGGLSEVEAGIAPRTFEEIFESGASGVWASMVAIDNYGGAEDLLAFLPNASQKPRDRRSSPVMVGDGNDVWVGARTRQAKAPQELVRMLDHGLSESQANHGNISEERCWLLRLTIIWSNDVRSVVLFGSFEVTEPADGPDEVLSYVLSGKGYDQYPIGPPLHCALSAVQRTLLVTCVSPAKGAGEQARKSLELALRAQNKKPMPAISHAISGLGAPPAPPSKLSPEQ